LVYNIKNMIEKYLVKKITWYQDKQNEILFNANVDGIKCGLRINNFPVEPMYTFSMGNEELDFDDKPELWEIIYNE